MPFLPELIIKTRILYGIYPYGWGGQEQFLFTFFKHLDRSKFEPIIASFDSSKFLEMFRSLRIPISIVPMGDKHSQPWIDFIKQKKIHLVQINALNIPLAVAARKARISILWRVGGCIEIAAKTLSPSQRKDYRNLISCLADQIVCPSRFLARQFNGKDHSGAVRIFNGIDIAGIDRIVKSARARSSQNSFSVAMVGHLRPQKRHIDFMYAAKKIHHKYPHSRFFVFGDRCKIDEGYRPYANKLFQKVKLLGLEQYFSIECSYGQVLQKLSEMDVVVLPSINEGASVAILEAMALGKPVVATRSGGNPELVQHGRTGILVPPQNPDRLASAITNLLNDRQKTKHMGEAGRRVAERSFDISASLKRYEKLYCQLTS